VRIGFLLLWLAVPVAAGFYHLGPGQEDLKSDLASVHLNKAVNFAEEGQWGAAQTYYAKALEALPSDQHDERQRIRLERAKALLNDSKLAPAYNELSVLIEELEGAETPDR
jgi:hypothetical protein